MPRNNRYLYNSILCSLVAVGLGACNSKVELVESHQTNSIQVTDYTGQVLELNNPAQRIISLAPHAVENIFSAGAGDKLVGVMAYSNFPDAAKTLPIIGSYESINFEKIIELNPDLIIAWESGNSDTSIKRLQELGFTVYIDHPTSLKDVAKSIRDIGILTDSSKPPSK